MGIGVFMGIVGMSFTTWGTETLALSKKLRLSFVVIYNLSKFILTFFLLYINILVSNHSPVVPQRREWQSPPEAE